MCFNEYDIKCIPRSDLTKRQKNLCNDELAINRDIVSCVLSSCLSSYKKPIKCLEGIGICGIYGMVWEKCFGEDVDVTINSFHEDDFNLISKNLKFNEMKGKVLNEDPCILLRKYSYDFIFLNCKTNATRYLDSVFSNIKEDAILVITTSEDPSLYWQTAEIALRNYGGIIAKTSYHREIAVRLVIAEMARVCAKYSKGLNILCTVAYKPQQSFTIFAKIKKGINKANDCIKNIKKLAYCSLCENREFISNSYFLDKLKNDLNCNCSKDSEGKVTIGIGPLWAGEIFDVEFIELIIQHSKMLSCKDRVFSLLNQILVESRCTAKSQEDYLPAKKAKTNDQIGVSTGTNAAPCFYINTHRHSAKEFRLQKISKIINLLHNHGYRASRTHFDSEAVRTNAPVSECINILRKNSCKIKNLI